MFNMVVDYHWKNSANQAHEIEAQPTQLTVQRLKANLFTTMTAKE